ncbi:MAG: hypothetical protein HRT88_15705 [Lentisphaeraceae bacterium]|nr:hypothetical protein [Lentisphaeraceae bacterium]
MKYIITAILSVSLFCDIFAQSTAVLTEPVEFSRSSSDQRPEKFAAVNLSNNLQEIFDEPTPEPTYSYTAVAGNGGGSTDKTSIAAETLVIFLEENNNFLIRTALSIVKELSKSPYFSSIKIYPAGHMLLSGQRAPDLYIRLRSNFQGDKYHLNMTGGSSFLPRYGPSFYKLFTSPKSHSTSSELEYTFFPNQKMGSFEDDGAWGAGKSIGQQLSKQYKGEFKAHLHRPNFPNSFYPTFKTAPNFTFLKSNNAKQLVSVHGLMVYNRSCWVFESTKPPVEVLPLISTELQAKNWKQDRLETNDDFQILSLSKEKMAMRVSVLNERDEPWVRSFFENKSSDKKYKYCVAYQHSMSKEDSWPVFKKLLEGNPLPLQAIMIATHLDKHKKDEVNIYLDKLTPQMTPYEKYLVADWKEWIIMSKQEDLLDLYIKVVLEFLWNTPSDKRLKKTYGLIKRYKALKHLRDPIYLPINLPEKTRNKYNIHSLKSILGKKNVMDINSTFAVSFAPEFLYAIFYTLSVLQRSPDLQRIVLILYQHGLQQIFYLISVPLIFCVLFLESLVSFLLYNQIYDQNS